MAGRSVSDRRAIILPASRRTARASLGLLVALLAAIGLLTAGPTSIALAHAVLQRSSVAPGSFIPAVPATLTLTFSENLAAGKANLRVSGPDGGSATTGAVQLLPNDRSLTVHLQSRGGGTYRVYWNSVSALDGKVIAGAFAFAVGYVSAAGDLSNRVAAHGAGALNAINLLAMLTQWLLLFVALAWAGGVMLEMPLGTSSSRANLSGESAWLTTIEAHARGVRYRLVAILLGLLLFSWLLAVAQVISAGRVSFIGGLGIFSGHLGLARLLALVLPLIALFDLRRPPAGERKPPRIAGATKRQNVKSSAVRLSAQQLPTLGRWGHLAIAALFLLSLAASGHAVGIPSITLSAVLLEWLHSLAAAAWIGGMAYLVLTALPVLDHQDLDKRAPLFLGLLRRYTAFAGAGIVGLVITGIFAAQEHVGTQAHLHGNPYGNTLLLKMLLTAGSLALTIYILIVQGGYLERIWAQRQRLESLGALVRMGRNLRIGTALGALVIGATAALGADAPPSITALSPVGASLPALPTGTWQPVGLRGMAVHRLLFQPHNRHVLWAATSTGVWRSVDDQQTWKRSGTALRKLTILDLLSLDDGRGLLAAAANGQLYRTYDAGRHWQRLGKPFSSHPLRVLAEHGGVILAAGDDGIFRSTDDSRHWHRVLTAGSQGFATVYWSAAENQFLAAVQGGSWQLYSAQADAKVWRAVPGAPSSAGVLALASTSTATPRFFAGAADDGGWVAPRSSGPWTEITGVTAGSTAAALLLDRRTLGRVYLGTDTGVYVTGDGGTTWVPLGSGSPKPITNLVMRPGPTQILYAATDNGAYMLRISG
ncbi:MAG: hypothetical protein JWO42_1957 [Chloroflexi bacterium]|nr:hypothetical protein [Chloroflexota bacterium]